MTCLELDDDEVRRIADPMMDDAMAGVARRDYALHCRHFSVALKGTLSPEAFLGACDRREAEWGSPGRRELVCVFRKPKSFTIVWEQGFDRADGQVLALATIALKGGRYFVDHFLLH